MKYEISETAYFAAIDRALGFIEEHPDSAGSEVLTILLANVWDSMVSANVGGILGQLDDERWQIAVDLLVGRRRHSRPVDHSRWKVIELLAREVHADRFR